jgi:hypothetical protein
MAARSGGDREALKKEHLQLDRSGDAKVRSSASIVLGFYSSASGSPGTTTRSGVNRPNFPSAPAANVWM